MAKENKGKGKGKGGMYVAPKKSPDKIVPPPAKKKPKKGNSAQ